MEEKEIGLYIHIPFCKQKCYYCDFISFTGKENIMESYVNCLKKEIIKYSNENKIMSSHGLEPEYVLKTIYIGGGTPSILDEMHILSILKTVKASFKIAKNPEITIEVNPGTVNKEKLDAYKIAGINRISIGLQAVQDELLKKIGRIHTYKEFEDTYNLAREVGFDNINVDLMINLPEQTLENVKESVKTIIGIKPEHISVYSLIVEENTKMCEMIDKKEVTISSDEDERKMYWYVKEALEKHKYCQYEISNFSKLGFESKHNTDCWNQKEYIGVGVAASSYLDDKRYSNIEDINKYIENIQNNTSSKNLVLEEIQNNESKMNEYMMLGLRKINGVNIFEFEKKFIQNPIVKYCKQLEKLNHEGLIEVNGSNIRLTNKGIDLANLVWEEFV